MIRDLSQTLQTILTQPGLPTELAAARIMFDRPSEQFNPTQTAQIIVLLISNILKDGGQLFFVFTEELGLKTPFIFHSRATFSRQIGCTT